MDTSYYRQALEEYRTATGDRTPAEQLPLAILSKLLLRAQELKTTAKEAL